jgi:hypothetical protein
MEDGEYMDGPSSSSSSSSSRDRERLEALGDAGGDDGKWRGFSGSSRTLAAAEHVRMI